MKRSKMNIRNFLIKRGFERMERNHYANDKCSVNLDEKHISIADNRAGYGGRVSVTVIGWRPIE